MIGPLKDNLMRIDLRFGAAEKLDAVRTNPGQLARHVSVRFQERANISWQFPQGDALITGAPTEVTGPVRPGGDLIRFG